MLTLSRYLIVIFGWTALAGFVVSTKAVHPGAIFAVWIIGFVWFSGWSASDRPKDGDNLVIYWLGMMTAIGVLGTVIAVLVS